MAKEITLVGQSATLFVKPEQVFDFKNVADLEVFRVSWKYFLLARSAAEQDRLWRRFAIQFIYESNAIEGSRLSQREVESIARNAYIKKTTERKEIQEVKNALAAFDLIRSGTFVLNERSLIALHALVTRGLGIAPGFKTHTIIVNNKETAPPGEVRKNLSQLFKWWKKTKASSRHLLAIAADFHSRFERIHPFEDGNGRVGRLLFLWMLMEKKYPPLLFRYRNRQRYFHALDLADEGRKQQWHWLCIRVYKETARMLMR